MANKKQTSPRVATLAGRTLNNPKASKQDKQLGASALSQTAGAPRKTR